MSAATPSLRSDAARGNCQSPSVTCVIGAYNHDRFVDEALESAIGQTYANLKVLVFDDASTDATQAQIRAFLAAHRDKSMKFVAHAENRGLCRSLNEVMDQVDSDYVAFVAADDIQEPDRIAKQVDILEELGPSYGVCYSDMVEIDEFGTILARSYFAASGNSDPPAGDIYEKMLEHMTVASPSALIRTSALRKAGKYDEDLGFEDYDMFLRLSSFTKFAYLPDQTVRYRILADSMWRTLSSDRVRFLADERAILRKHLGACGRAGRVATARFVELTKQLYLLGEAPSTSSANFGILPADARRGRTLAYHFAARAGIPGRWLAAPARATRWCRNRLRRQ